MGLIPPRGLENFALGSNFHLALALPNLMARKTYGLMYARAARLGDFVVLDNGAAEGELVMDDVLMASADKIGASEVVAPDVIRNGADTLERTNAFIRKWKPLNPLMAVPQGIKLDEFQKCVRAWNSVEHISTIGIPRHMIATLGVKSSRIDFANWILDKFENRFAIHLLGMDPNWPQEIKHAAKYAQHIRSVDSSLPFNYAIQDLSIAVTKQVVHRPPGYFTRDWNGRVATRLVRQNIQTLVEWAGAPVLRDVNV